MDSSLIWILLIIIGAVAIGCASAIIVATVYLVNHWRRHRAGLRS